MTDLKKWLSLALVAFLLVGSASFLAGCAESHENTTETETESSSVVTETEADGRGPPL